MIDGWLILGVLAVAFCYSMVGHGGASGYLALLAFSSIPGAVGATTALALNIVVAGITLLVFGRAKHFSFELAWPLLIGSVPFAFLGGLLRFDNRWQDLLLTVILLYSAVMLMVGESDKDQRPETPGRGWLIVTGSGIGLISGIVGVGGGIFLSPLMVLKGWAQSHKVAALSAGFIFANSMAGLAARPASLLFESLALWPLVFFGACGAILGSTVGANRVSNLGLRRLLGIVLLIAVAKLFQKVLTL